MGLFRANTNKLKMNIINKHRLQKTLPASGKPAGQNRKHSQRFDLKATKNKLSE